MYLSKSILYTRYTIIGLRSFALKNIKPHQDESIARRDLLVTAARCHGKRQLARVARFSRRILSNRRITPSKTANNPTP